MTKIPGILEDAEQQELIIELCEEVKQLLAESHFNQSQAVIETNHRIGRTIITNPAYKKGAHGNGKVLEQIALTTGKSESHLHHCIQFYEKFPSIADALSTLAPDSKSLSWHQVVHELADSHDGQCDHKKSKTVMFEICLGCGLKTKLN